MTWRN